MKIIIIAIVYSITIIVSPLIGMDQSGAPSKNRYLQKPNRYMNPDRVNPLLKPAAKPSASNSSSLPSQEVAFQGLKTPSIDRKTADIVDAEVLSQPCVEASDIALKSIDEIRKLLDTAMERFIKGENVSVEELEALKKQMEAITNAHTAACEKRLAMHKAVHDQKMAALDAQRAKFDEEHNAKMADLNAQLAAQEIRHAKEREEQKIELEKADARLAANDAAFKQRMARLRAQHQLP